MKYSQTIGIMAVCVIIINSFFHWIYIPTLHLYLDGFHGVVNENLDFGKQGFVYIFLGFWLIIFFTIPRIWAKRANLFMGFILLAWVIRNTVLFSICRNAECPKIKFPLYCILLMAFVVITMTLLPKIKKNS